jgi:hypothetical protein
MLSREDSIIGARALTRLAAERESYGILGHPGETKESLTSLVASLRSAAQHLKEPSEPVTGTAEVKTHDADDAPTPIPLTKQHVNGARLFANRRDAIQDYVRGGTFVEVGVALGEFSQFVIDNCRPEKFYAIDIFEMHTWPSMWGKSSAEVFGSLTHEEQYRNRFEAEISAGKMNVLSQDSREALASIPEKTADLVYIDAWHKYENVKAELEECKRILSPNGLVVLNDYIMYDYFAHTKYGVVQAVNEFVVQNNWCVEFFALDAHMFCDIAIRPHR